jgi:hypothetical protein
MNQFSSFISSPIFTALTGPTLIIFMIVLFWYRTGTIHSLLERLWRLAAGKIEVGDPQLNKFIKETRDLERFRFIYGLKVGNPEDLHKLLAWLKKHSIDIDLAQRAKKWIDIKTAEIIVSPSKGYVVRQGISVIFYGLLAIGASSVSSSHLALLQMEATGTWFLTDAKSVRPIVGDWLIDATRCEKKPAELVLGTGFSENEATLICDALKTDGLNELVKTTTRQQEISGFGLACGLFVLILIGLARLGAANAAKKIHTLIKSPAH